MTIYIFSSFSRRKDFFIGLDEIIVVNPDPDASYVHIYKSNIKIFGENMIATCRELERRGAHVVANAHYVKHISRGTKEFNLPYFEDKFPPFPEILPERYENGTVVSRRLRGTGEYVETSVWMDRIVMEV